MFSFEFINEVVNESVVEVLTTQVSIASGRLDFEDTLLNCQEGDIECTTTKVEDEDIALTFSLLVETIGDGSGSGFVDDSENVETSNETGIFGGLTLRVVEIGRHGDDGIVDGATKVGFSSLSHLGQDHRGDLLGSELLLFALELNLHDGLALLLNDLEGKVLHVSLHLSVVELASNQSLGIEDCVGRVHGDLVLCGISDQTLGVGEGHERGSSSVALVVGNNFDAVISEDAHTGVGGTKIDS